jgi:hypothetical protein
MRRLLSIALLFVWFASTTRAQDKEATPDKINSAIDRGVARLLERYADGQAVIPKAQPGTGAELNRAGMRALVLYTLLKSGVPAHAPVVEKLVARLAFEHFDMTYDAACMLLALNALDPVGERAWIAELATFLITHRLSSGEFAYPTGNGDLSNTQFAALGLRAAAEADIPIPPDVWSDLAHAVLRHNTSDGGFSYRIDEAASSDTMTAAGVGVLAVCETQLARAGALDPNLAGLMRRARSAGQASLGTRLDPGLDAGRSGWLHYFLYALERVGGLCGIDKLGAHDWYHEGAAFLVETQDSRGEWRGNSDPCSTLFALLFLSRATSGVATGGRAAGPATGARAPTPLFPHTPGSDVVGGMRLEVRGQERLRMWIEHVASPANAPYEWPGERGRGPHVALVEYLVDGSPIEVVLGDSEHPAGEQRFLCEHRGLPRGHHRLTVRVHVRMPDTRAADAAHERPSNFDDGVITSNGVEVEITEDIPRIQVEAPFAPAQDLLLQSRPEVTSSSFLKKAAWIDNTVFAASQVVDGNPRAPWIAAVQDAQPYVCIHLGEPKRADVVRIAPARLVPRNPDFLTLPKEISVRIDGDTAHVLPVDPAKFWVELVLPKPVNITQVEIRLVGREGPAAAVGIGEVVLERRSN